MKPALIVIGLLVNIIVIHSLSLTAYASDILLNEIMAHPSEDDTEWVELINTSNAEIDLTGWIIRDGNSQDNDDLILSGNIKPGEIIAYANTKNATWLNNFSSKSSTPETIKLFNGTEPINDYAYDKTYIGKSFSRIPDGSTNWTVGTEPTRGTANSYLITNSPIPSPTYSQVTNTPTLSPTKTPPKVTISDNPSTQNSNQSFSVKVRMEGFPTNSKYFLKGAFFKTTNYFGKTKVDGIWIKYGEGYTSQYPISTNDQGEFEGNIEILADTEDSGFTDAGEYNFRVGYYKEGSSSVSWSNQVIITLYAAQITPESPPTNTPTSKSQTATVTPKPTGKVLSASTSGVTSPTVTTKSAELQSSGEPFSIDLDTQSNPLDNQTKSGRDNRWIFILSGLLLFFAGISTFVYYLKSREVSSV